MQDRPLLLNQWKDWSCTSVITASHRTPWYLLHQLSIPCLPNGPSCGDANCLPRKKSSSLTSSIKPGERPTKKRTLSHIDKVKLQQKSAWSTDSGSWLINTAVSSDWFSNPEVDLEWSSRDLRRDRSLSVLLFVMNHFSSMGGEYAG